MILLFAPYAIALRNSASTPLGSTFLCMGKRIIWSQNDMRDRSTITSVHAHESVYQNSCRSSCLDHGTHTWTIRENISKSLPPGEKIEERSVFKFTSESLSLHVRLQILDQAIVLQVSHMSIEFIDNLIQDILIVDVVHCHEIELFVIEIYSTVEMHVSPPSTE